MVECFKIKHLSTEEDIVKVWLEASESARDIILGDKPITGLTTLAHYRTLEGLRRRNDCLS